MNFANLLGLPPDIVNRIRHHVFRRRCDHLERLLLITPKPQACLIGAFECMALTQFLPSGYRYVRLVVKLEVDLCWKTFSVFDNKEHLVATYYNELDGVYCKMI